MLGFRVAGVCSRTSANLKGPLIGFHVSSGEFRNSGLGLCVPLEAEG